MFWELFSLAKLINPAELMRRRHSEWLTRALRQPSQYPRIPVCPVADGGFGPTLATPDGPAWANQWWSETLCNEELDL